jgi:hypothetical protein
MECFVDVKKEEKKKHAKEEKKLTMIPDLVLVPEKIIMFCQKKITRWRT